MTISEHRTGSPKSPLSAVPPRKVRDLSRAFLLEQLAAYHRVQPPPQVVECDYSLWRCSETGLEFAWPMRPGNACFYAWVSSFASYYPATRWEYSEVCRCLEAEQRAGRAFSKVLDVGCGRGNFLRGLDFIPADRRFGLDLNEAGVEACRGQGFQAYCGTVDAALDAGFVAAAEFPVVTSFHCLEHVDDPLAFVGALTRIAAPGGRLFLSTPYSPMSFESEWFDVLNHPPHHMTRWNPKAYQRLAEMLGLKLRCLFPQSSLAKQTVMTFRLLRYGPNRPLGMARLGADLLRDLPLLLRSYRAPMARAHRNGGIAADVILAELSVP